MPRETPHSREASFFFIMIFRMVNQFLEIWFQNLDAWIMYYQRMPDDEHKMAFIAATREMMEGFLSALEEIETDPLNNLPFMDEETKQPESPEE